eukprot:GGOE01023254.1.p1 GENE.GGOE01023254.1~~GGOE01023254.1.p1  ORF type:complete len:832 (-),score=177.95 GGOE01023254.1:465-2960(-)
MSRGQKKQRPGDARGKSADGQAPRQSADPFYDHELPVEGIAAISTSIAHDSEIEQYIAQEHLSPADRAIYLFENGSNLQKCSVVEGLQRLVAICSNIEIDSVISALTELLWKVDEDVQMSAGDGMLEALPGLNLAHLRSLFPLLKTMICLRIEAVRDRWRPVMLTYINHFPAEEMQQEIIQFAFELSDPSEPPDLRKLCCEMIGTLFPRLSSDMKEGPFLQRVLSFCQDTDFNVRIGMCGQLSPIAHVVGLQRAKSFVTKELFELLEDEERGVVHAAFTSLVDMIDFFDDQFRRERILPLIKGYLANPSEEDSQMLLSCFGKYIWELSGDLKSEEDIQLFCNFFNNKALQNDLDAQSSAFRSFCAFNFPAVVRSLGTKKYFSYLSLTYKCLCEDSNVETRRRMAAGFHEVSIILREKSLPHLHEPFFVLAQDPELEVQDAIFANLGAILRSFSCAVNDDRQIFNDCIPAICTYEAAIKSCWRKVIRFLDQFDQFPAYFSSDVLYEKFIPILFRHMSQNTVEVKDKCAWLIMCFTRKLHNHTQQVEIINRILTEFGRARSYWHRQTFIICCLRCLEHFSRKFFREKMVDTTLELAKDPVANVRRKLCLLLPHIKLVLRPPAPVDLLAIFNERVARLAMDPDKDVADGAREAISRMEEMEDDLLRKQDLGLQDEDERLDGQREEEENTLMEAAHEIEKQQRRKALRELIAEGEKALPNAPPTPQAVLSLGHQFAKPDPTAARGRTKKPLNMPARPALAPPAPPARTAPVVLSKLTPKPEHPRLPSAGNEPRKQIVSPGSSPQRKESKDSTPTLPSVLPTLTVSGRVGITAKRR